MEVICSVALSQGPSRKQRTCSEAGTLRECKEGPTSKGGGRAWGKRGGGAVSRGGAVSPRPRSLTVGSSWRTGRRRAQGLCGEGGPRAEPTCSHPSGGSRKNGCPDSVSSLPPNLPPMCPGQRLRMRRGRCPWAQGRWRRVESRAGGTCRGQTGGGLHPAVPLHKQVPSIGISIRCM